MYILLMFMHVYVHICACIYIGLCVYVCVWYLGTCTYQKRTLPLSYAPIIPAFFPFSF